MALCHSFKLDRVLVFATPLLAGCQGTIRVINVSTNSGIAGMPIIRMNRSNADLHTLRSLFQAGEQP